MHDSNLVIVALDVPSREVAITLANRLSPTQCRLKVGMELYTAVGPQIIEDLQRLGFQIFLDLKFHDIPNTVAGAIRSAAELGVWMVNVHCLGGRKMMESAENAVAGFPRESRPLVIGVTILTSMDGKDLEEVGIGGQAVLLSPDDSTDPKWDDQSSRYTHRVVAHLARLAFDAGLDGVVCSGQEVALVRFATSETFVLVTPGIRLPVGNVDDQARIVTPQTAISLGSNYLVVGRPITQALDPSLALREFHDLALSARA